MKWMRTNENPYFDGSNYCLFYFIFGRQAGLLRAWRNIYWWSTYYRRKAGNCIDDAPPGYGIPWTHSPTIYSVKQVAVTDRATDEDGKKFYTITARMNMCFLISRFSRPESMQPATVIYIRTVNTAIYSFWIPAWTESLSTQIRRNYHDVCKQRK